MPTYVYRFVDTDETIEVQQSFTEDSLTEIAHPDSGEMMPVKKVFQPVGVTFKGSGFFKTDSRSGSGGSGSGGSGSGGSSSSGSGSSSSSSDSTSSSTSSSSGSGSSGGGGSSSGDAASSSSSASSN